MRLLFLFVLFIPFIGQAQALLPSPLLGSWRAEGYSLNAHYTRYEQPNRSYMVFAEAQLCYSVQQDSLGNTWSVVQEFWAFTSDSCFTILPSATALLERKNIQPGNQFCIRVHTDSLLVLDTYEGKTPVSVTYTKVAPVSRVVVSPKKNKLLADRLIGGWELLFAVVKADTVVPPDRNTQTFNYDETVNYSVFKEQNREYYFSEKYYSFFRDSCLLIVDMLEYLKVSSQYRPDNTYCILSLTDSSLVLSSVKQGIPISLHYRATESVFTINPETTPNYPQPLLWLVNTADTTQWKQLEYDNRSYDFELHGTSVFYETTNFCTAIILSSTDSTLLLDISEETTQETDTITDEEYQKSISTTTGVRRWVRKEEIVSIEYSTNKREKLRGYGGFLLSLGSITTLLVAPIISIGFNNGLTFREQRYFRTAGIGLGGIVSGTALLIAGKQRTFRIVPKNSGRISRKYWYFS